MTNQLSDYEKTQLQMIHLWKNPEITWFDTMSAVVSAPFQAVGDTVMRIPGAEDALQKTFGGLVGLLNDFAQWSVSPDAIYADFRKNGHHDTVNADAIFALDLKDVDKMSAWLKTQYTALAATEGGAFGAMGLPGIAPDIIALLTLNLKAIGTYATYYGFDISRQEERLFALNLLALSSSPNDASKQIALAQLIKIAKEAAQKKTWKTLERHFFVQVIKKLAEVLGIRLTKAKLAQLVPVTGGLVGAGFNAYFTGKVCDSAYYLYRERFLAQKYGSEVIEITVNPAKDLDPDYQD